MAGELSYFLTGAAFGATAGLSPGPLQALVITETLRHGRKEGFKVSFAPLLTDLPIILLAVFLLSRLTDFSAIMGGVSIGGALFLAYLAYGNIRGGDPAPDQAEVKPDSLKKAAITNFLNPHPYMFWVLVGAPTLFSASRDGILAAPAFIAGFYLVLVGAFGLIATATGRSRGWVRGRLYRWVMRFLGVALAVFSLLFFLKGIRLLGIL